jgi:hypothetical protein
VPGQYQLTAAYSGDSTHEPGSDTFQMSVAKAGSTIDASGIPPVVKVKKKIEPVQLTVQGDDDVLATGTVRVTVPGQPVRIVQLSAGSAVLELDKFTTTGTKDILIEYLGSNLVQASSTTVQIEVVKK